MNTDVFRKHYRTPDAAHAAANHHTWLTGLDSGLSFPTLLRHRDTTLEFEHISGPTAEPADLPVIARALGQLHHAARRHGMIHADINQPFPLNGSGTLAGFAPPRRERLHAALSTTRSPLSGELVDAWLDAATHFPGALYKDANPRNVILSDSRGPVLVDFDTLTLAPAGYDLAKLVVTTAMTFGPLTRQHAVNALHAYTTSLGLGQNACPFGHIQVWAEFHHLLTSPWLGCHYTHDWATVRPWPTDEIASAARTPTNTPRS
ncbi:phosphotransferase [Amycolatopsis palatopharyngis]|uniref:phosphotransferase n=1 Tax=Amycolatopsis palatopharyngis TaxID=187982 RepID=UPI000E24BBF4|nr:phosphotransferase [Amycolatopsis palatopharyngis]